MKEVWKDIIEYEGIYQISNQGRVRSLDRVVKDKNRNRFQHIKGKLLIANDNGYGYLIVCLRKDGVRCNKYVHRLVAEAFLPNMDNKREVNHINLNKHDNRVENLEWVTSSENKVHFVNTDVGKICRITGGVTRFSNIVDEHVEDIIYRYVIKRDTIKNIADDYNLYPRNCI